MPEPLSYGNMRIPWLLGALFAYCLIAVSLTGPALLGHGSLTPEGFLDRDKLYEQPAGRAALRPFEDPTPVVIEFGRERAVALGAAKGRLDSWNPWSGAGAPLWAEQGNPFFPTKLLAFISPHHSTLMASLATRLVLVALGVFVLARALGLSAPVALFTGALFEYSGSAAANLAYANSSAIYVLPWVLWGARKLCAERSGIAVAVSAIGLAAALLGGHPSLALIVCLAFGAWILGQTLQERPSLRDVVRITGLAVAAGILAALMAAVGLLPFLELLIHGHSYKNADISETIWQDRLGWTRGVFGMAMFFPSIITATRDTIGYNMWPWAQGASIGLVGVLLAIVGMRIFRQSWGLACVGVLGIGLTLAPFGLHWLHELPGVRIVLPWYCYPLVALPLCIAAGYGLQNLLDHLDQRKLRIALGLILALTTVAVLLALPITWRVREAVAQLVGHDILTEWLVAPLRLNLLHLSVWPMLVSPLAALAAVWAYGHFGRSRLYLAATILAVVALVEAAAVRIPTILFERSVVAQSVPSTATRQLQALLEGGSWRFTAVPPLDVAGPNSSLLFELRDLRSFSALAVRRHAKYIELAGKQSEDPWNHPQWQYPPTIRLPMLALAAVRYVVYTRQYRDANGVSPGLKELGAVGDIVFYENPLALERFRITHETIPAENEQQAFDILQRLLAAPPGADPGAQLRSTVIEGLVPESGAGLVQEQDPSASTESIRIVAEPDPQTIVMEANLAKPGFVVLSDTFYPGWTATLNGSPTRIYPANLMFRAVAVPKGKHSITMHYRSRWLPIGAGLSLLGLLCACVLIVRPLITRKHNSGIT